MTNPIIPQPGQANQEAPPRRVSRFVRQRAGCLYQEGYRIENYVFGTFKLFTLDGAKSHIVDAQNDTCDCRAAQRGIVCAHRLGWEQLLLDTCAEYTERMERLGRLREGAKAGEGAAVLARILRLETAAWELWSVLAALNGRDWWVPDRFEGYVGVNDLERRAR